MLRLKASTRAKYVAGCLSILGEKHLSLGHYPKDGGGMLFEQDGFPYNVESRLCGMSKG